MFGDSGYLLTLAGTPWCMFILEVNTVIAIASELCLSLGGQELNVGPI